jgi:hypothetical protein
MKIFIVAIIMALTACTSCTAPGPTIYGAVPLPITDQYRAWWWHIEQCSGLHGDINAVQLFKVDSLSDHAVARQVSPPMRIYLVDIFVSDSLVVQHEMLHALGVQGHPAQYFNGACGDLRGGGQL